MAQAVPKRDWLEAEENLARTAYLEFLVEHWLWELPASFAATKQLERPFAELPPRQKAIHTSGLRLVSRTGIDRFALKLIHSD